MTQSKVAQADEEKLMIWQLTIFQLSSHVCVLHNICKVHGDTFNDAWLRELENNVEFPQPPPSHTRDGGDSRPKQVRDTLMYYFCS